MELFYERDVRPHLQQTEGADRVVLYAPPVLRIGGRVQYMPVDPNAPPRYLDGVTTVMAEALVTTNNRGGYDGHDVAHPTYVHQPPPSIYWPVSQTEQHMEKLEEERQRRINPIGAMQQRLKGTALGTLTHQQIQDALRYDRVGFERAHPGGTVKEAARYLRLLVARNWLPLRGEYVVFDTTLDMATPVDNVAVALDGTLGLFETKTGYKNCFDVVQRGTRWRAGTPMTQWANFPPTPANLALVQHALTTMLAVRCLRLGDVPYRSFVAHICDDGVDVRELTAEFLNEAGVQLWAYLSARGIEADEK